MSKNDTNLETVDDEKRARIAGLRQVLAMTSDEVSMAEYSRISGIDVVLLPDMRRAWFAELRELEGNPLTLDEIKAGAIVETRFMLGRILETPISFKGKLYSVTLEKQNLLSAQLGIFGLNKQSGIPTELSWNATGQSCEPWKFEDLLALSNAIREHVKPLAQMQRDAEVSIKKSKSEKDVRNVITKYGKDLERAVAV